MLSQIVNRPCTITRRLASVSEDEFGNEIPDEEEVVTVCELQQRSTDELGEQGELADARWQAFFFPAEAIRTGDKLTVDGEEYEVVGDPWRARDPLTQAGSHIEVNLRRTSSSLDEVGS